MGLPGDKTGSDAAHLAGRIEHGVVLALEVRSALHGHGTAGVAVGLFDLFLGESQVPQQLEAGLVVVCGIQSELFLQQLLAHDGGHKGRLDGESAGQRFVDPFQRRIRKSLGFQLFP